MASDILGLFTTPEQYQQNQLAQFQNRAAQEVQMSPFQQAALGARTAGYQLGQGIGGALGGQDPQLKMISMRQQLASQLDPTNLDTYKLVAQDAANRGDTQFAMAVADAGRQAAIQVAQANKERQLAVPSKIQELNLLFKVQDNLRRIKLLPQSGERDNAIKILEERISAINPTKTEATPNEIQISKALALQKGAEGTTEYNTEFQKQLLRQTEGKAEATSSEMKNAAALADRTAERNTPEWNEKYSTELARLTTKETKQNISKIGVSKLTGEAVYYDEGKNLQYVLKTDPNDPTKQIRSPFTGSVDQTTSNVQQTAGFKQAAGINQNKLDFAKAVEENAFSASDRISLAQSLRELSPKAFTGFAADAKLTASKVASAFGIPTKGGTESEIIDQILGQMTIGAAGQLKGALSDKDVLFLKKTIGTRGLSVNTLLFVADEIERLAAQDRHLNKRINQVTQSGGNLNEVNFEEEKSKSAKFVKTQMSEYRSLLKKVANNTATLEEATKARQIRDELGL
jgi:hypothetical protein